MEGVKAQAKNIGADRAAAGSVNALVNAYLNLESSSPFKAGAPETQRTRRNVLENFATKHGDKPLYRIDGSGRRIMLLDRAHMQKEAGGATPGSSA
jgi:hypothetical protein